MRHSLVVLVDIHDPEQNRSLILDGPADAREGPYQADARTWIESFPKFPPVVPGREVGKFLAGGNSLGRRPVPHRAVKVTRLKGLSCWPI